MRDKAAAVVRAPHLCGRLLLFWFNSTHGDSALAYRSGGEASRGERDGSVTAAAEEPL